ncbi:hypothetical protein [Aeromicrobium sp. UC242_57]|uniref:hypothetical protein n=1 Tax=Aeromicrobium sp. UC242_57 TaxID=3374624 RepID=UPI003797C8F1
MTVDQGLAGDEHLKVGDQVTLLTLAGGQPVQVVGITEFGDWTPLTAAGPSRSVRRTPSPG